MESLSIKDLELPSAQPDELPPAQPDELPPAQERELPSAQPDEQAAKHPALAARYHDLRKIGAGSQGTMLRARDSDGNPVAIKVFDLKAAESLKSLDLFEREIETLRQINCSGVPRYIDRIESDSCIYLVEEYINAPSLDTLIRENKKYTFDDIEVLFRNTLEILKVLGEYVPPVIHRDLKPGNLLVDENLHVWLVDFGVVADKYQRTLAMTFAGTAGYLAPEQLYGKATPASDIFALGMTFVHLVSRVSPCDMNSEGLVPEIDKYMPVNIPQWFVAVLKEMICADPSKRLKNASDVLCFMEKAKNSHEAKNKNSVNEINSDGSNDDGHSAQPKEKRAELKKDSGTIDIVQSHDAKEKELSLYYRNSHLSLNNFNMGVFSVPLGLVFILILFGIFVLQKLDLFFFSNMFAVIFPPIFLIFSLIIISDTPESKKAFIKNKQELRQKAIEMNALLKKMMFKKNFIRLDNNSEYNRNYNQLLDKKGSYDALDSEEEQRLQDYLNNEEKQYPCVTYKPEFVMSKEKWVKEILYSIAMPILGGFVMYTSELAHNWNIFLAITLGFFIFTVLRFWLRFIRELKPRMEDVEYQDAYELYLRKFMTEEYTDQPSAEKGSQPEGNSGC